MNPNMRLYVEAELKLPFASSRISRFEIADHCEAVLLNEASYVLDLSLTPRATGAKARYRDHWPAGRATSIGALYIVPPGHALEIKCGAGVSRSVICEVRGEHLAGWLQEDVAWTDRGRELSLGVHSTNMHALLRRLADELRNPGLAHETMVELSAAQIALELARFCTSVPGSSWTGGLTSRQLHIIDERIACGGPSPSLKELATLCNMSVRQLARAFRASRGCTVGDYIAHCRVELAMRRLQTRESVKSIARCLGFGSPSSFAYAFRKLTGTSPRQYRLAH
jgi:AraC family transcriptional regulator